MSGLNGDKARYQRLRQAGLRRRELSRQAQAELRAEAARKAAVAANPGLPIGRARQTAPSVATKAGSA